MLALPFVSARNSSYSGGPNMISGIRSTGFWFLAGVRSIIWMRVDGTSGWKVVPLNEILGNSTSAWISASLMLVLFAVTVWLIIGCVRKVIRNESVASSKYFPVKLVIMAVCHISLFIFSLVINAQLLEVYESAFAVTVTFTFSWLSTLFFIAAVLWYRYWYENIGG